jgi:ABC-type nitrate/sulfonate/bicarbonate transport system permease component
MRRQRLLLPLCILLSGLGIWEAAVHIYQMPHYILPAPSAIAVTLVQKRASLGHHTLVTLQEMLLGFGLATTVGITLSVLMFEVPVLERALYPYVIGSQTVPVFAIAPLLVLWLGYGIMSKVLMAAIIVFFPIVLNTLDGLKAADADTVSLLRVMRANRWQLLCKVQFPSALPFMLSGAKIGISISTIGAVIGEWVGARAGLGRLMLDANSQLQVSLVFAAILCLTVMGLVLFGLMTLIERWLTPWRHLDHQHF